MYLRTPLPVPFLKQLSARFPHCWKDARPCCCTPGICHRSCLGRWGVLPKIEWVAPSMIGQWIYVFFHRRHPNVRNRPTILVSLESTGTCQRNGAILLSQQAHFSPVRSMVWTYPLSPVKSGGAIVICIPVASIISSVQSLMVTPCNQQNWLLDFVLLYLVLSFRLVSLC